MEWEYWGRSLGVSELDRVPHTKGIWWNVFEWPMDIPQRTHVHIISHYNYWVKNISKFILLNFPKKICSYGNTAPVTDYGKIITILYAVFGIPIYILYFQNIGKVFARAFKWAYQYIEKWIEERRRRKGKVSNFVYVTEENQKFTVPTTACVLVLVSYIAIGEDIFSWLFLFIVYLFRHTYIFKLRGLELLGFNILLPDFSS